MFIIQDTLIYQFSERLNVLYERNWTMLVHEQLRRFEGSIIRATKSGLNESLGERSRWSFTEALLYSVTLITTIGKFLWFIYLWVEFSSIIVDSIRILWKLKFHSCILLDICFCGIWMKNVLYVIENKNQSNNINMKVVHMQK